MKRTQKSTTKKSKTFVQTVKNYLYTADAIDIFLVIGSLTVVARVLYSLI